MNTSKMQREFYERYQIAKALKTRKVSRGIVARELGQ
jgi:hypothetical protein